MRAEKIQYLLGRLGADRISGVAQTSRGPMIRSTCPLGMWRHKSGGDKHPSFAVFVAADDLSHCKCLGCGFKGTLQTLVWAIQQASKSDVKELSEYVRNNDHVNLGGELKKLERLETSAGFYSNPGTSSLYDLVGKGRDLSDVLSLSDAIPGIKQEHVQVVAKMASLIDEEARWYLNEKRGLSDETIAAWKLGWHPGVRRISIPQFDRNGRLVNVAGRHVPHFLDVDWDPPPWMHALDFKKEFYLFGEDRLSYSADGKGTAFLVEGMFDTIWLSQQGIPNVVAMLGANLSRYQMDKLVRWFDRLIMIPDGDGPGYEAANRISQSLGQRIEMVVFPTPEGLDPDELSAEDVSKIKSFLPS